ncbi:PEP-CTERM sorting domain-containing protein [Saccharophagus degradans]|uniref:Ice-binding protein C-terminal domain-containing protein n=1 Tax=Saccharophagus degradans (strain 2-40 / ATCC 43961 / DSM 17024) TaxID=203122 RepID=Q21M70_SACD2|nr:PEP-CTERM sorting domain-containing protein [Saccharophagus degradans]ABD80209.1 hypothetical protein Sde_0947 [Saccharophagus degradans 2-40]
MFTRFTKALTTCLLLAVASQALAIPTTVLDANSSLFNGATTLSFDGESKGSFSSRSFNNGDITFSVLTGTSLSINDQFSASGFAFNLQSEYLNSPSTTTSFRVDFNVAIDTFGFTWAARDTQWVVELFGENNNSLGSVNANHVRRVYTDFFGVSESEYRITSAVFTATTADVIMLDNFKYAANLASVANVPEPGSVLLFAIGFIALGLFRKLAK